MAVTAGLTGILALTGYSSLPLLRCPDTCFIDYVTLHGGEIGNFELPDARLNSWILGWVQHSWLTASPLFDTNAFHPARNTLAGSEHMVAIALLTLPVRLFTDSAIALHQVAVVLSFAILGWAVFACVRWATGSTLAAFLAGAAALFMPWRFSEVSHLQLLSAQWLPLVWLLTARMLLGQGGPRHTFALAIVVALQLLSSFYLAYFTLFSTTFLAAGLALGRRPRGRDLVQVGLAIVPGLLALLALSLPYVSRYTAYRWASPVVIPESTPPELVWEFLRPSLALVADRERLAGVSYYVPLAVFALALVPYLPARLRSGVGVPNERDDRIRNLALGIGAAVVGAAVFMMGRQIHLFGSDWPLPATLAAKLLPGFSQMRAEFRWGIVIGVAAPILAGLGIGALERRCLAARAAPAWRRPLFAVAAAALLAVNVPVFQLPAKAAWRSEDGIAEAHEQLAALEPGPVLEIPWRFRRLHLSNYGSRYMLASSANWHPLLNGYTAYLPPTHFFLQRIGQDLPDPQALDRLERLTGLRWIIVHEARLKPWERKRWESAERGGRLKRVSAGEGTWIYEVAPSAHSGEWLDAIVAEAPRERTLAGLSRTPLPRDQTHGTFRVRAPEVMVFQHDLGTHTSVDLEIVNDSETPWPGFDIQTDGLVLLRYRFVSTTGEIEREDVAPLDADLPAGRRTPARAIVKPPARVDRFEIVFELVQQRGEDYVALEVPSVRHEVRIERAQSPSSRMRDALRERSRDPTQNRPD